LVGVFPEGFKGVGKQLRDRYKLQASAGRVRGGRAKTGVPIVPVAIVGAEETYPLIADIKPLARLLGMPYFRSRDVPWLGPLGAIPLPSKWLIEFCPPIETAHLVDAADDPMVVFNLATGKRDDPADLKTTMGSSAASTRWAVFDGGQNSMSHLDGSGIAPSGRARGTSA